MKSPDLSKFKINKSDNYLKKDKRKKSGAPSKNSEDLLSEKITVNFKKNEIKKLQKNAENEGHGMIATFIRMVLKKGNYI